MKKLKMKASWFLIAISTGFVAFCNIAAADKLNGDYILLSADLSDQEINPHTFTTTSVRILNEGDKYEITIDDISGNEPTTVPLHVEGNRVSFFLPPRKFTRDEKLLTMGAKAYFGEIVLDLYIAGQMTSGERFKAFKLERVKSNSAKTDG